MPCQQLTVDDELRDLQVDARLLDLAAARFTAATDFVTSRQQGEYSTATRLAVRRQVRELTIAGRQLAVDGRR